MNQTTTKKECRKKSKGPTTNLFNLIDCRWWVWERAELLEKYKNVQCILVRWMITKMSIIYKTKGKNARNWHMIPECTKTWDWAPANREKKMAVTWHELNHGARKRKITGSNELILIIHKQELHNSCERISCDTKSKRYFRKMENSTDLDGFVAFIEIIRCRK